MVLVKTSLVPPLIAVKVIVNVPELENIAPGFATEDVFPLPKSQI